MSLVLLCHIDDLNQNGQYIKYIEEIRDEIIAYKHEDTIYVKSSFCPHYGGDLRYNEKTQKLRCSWHDWKFCPKEGKCTSHQYRGKLREYNFEIKENQIFVEKL